MALGSLGPSWENKCIESGDGAILLDVASYNRYLQVLCADCGVLKECYESRKCARFKELPPKSPFDDILPT